jgi:hypothetical protein
MHCRAYLAWANTYKRSLRQPGMESAKRRNPALAEHFAARTARAAAGGGTA